MSTGRTGSGLGLAFLPTPFEPMHRLRERLGVNAQLFVKRDDLTGLALGGNKARKLERLCADALGQGCDTLVTGGGPQSNHARMTAAAANRLGMGCHLALAGERPEHVEGNLLLDRLFGAHIEFTGAREYYEIEESIDAAADRLTDAGQHPYAIPVGGASIAGAAAYALAVDEMREQIGTDPDWIFVADGSGGTHAGLAAGLGPTSETRVVGVDVGTRPDLETIVPQLAAQAAKSLGRDVPTQPVIVDHDHFGDGYGALTDGGLDALRALARAEGIVADPVYSAKAADALFTWLRDGRVGNNETVVFWHTGGAPALFASRYEAALTQDD